MYKQNITNLYELLVVVPDEVYEQAKTIGSHTVKNIDVKDERNSKVLTEKLKKVISEEDAEGESNSVTSIQYSAAVLKRQG